MEVFFDPKVVISVVTTIGTVLVAVVKFSMSVNVLKKDLVHKLDLDSIKTNSTIQKQIERFDVFEKDLLEIKEDLKNRDLLENLHGTWEQQLRSIFRNVSPLIEEEKDLHSFLEKYCDEFVKATLYNIKNATAENFHVIARPNISVWTSIFHEYEPILGEEFFRKIEKKHKEMVFQLGDDIYDAITNPLNQYKSNMFNISSVFLSKVISFFHKNYLGII